MIRCVWVICPNDSNESQNNSCHSLDIDADSWSGYQILGVDCVCAAGLIWRCISLLVLFIIFRDGENLESFHWTISRLKWTDRAVRVLLFKYCEGKEFRFTFLSLLQITSNTSNAWPCEVKDGVAAYCMLLSLLHVILSYYISDVFHGQLNTHTYQIFPHPILHCMSPVFGFHLCSLWKLLITTILLNANCKTIICLCQWCFLKYSFQHIHWVTQMKELLNPHTFTQYNNNTLNL